MRQITSGEFTIEFDQETDGRIIAEVLELPGVMVCGTSESYALERVQALTLWVLADKLKNKPFDRR